ncbi:MAG: competence/damage-inducible protein A [Clostridia bacterium]|nr:competence/damage-inducible protein A [Clostridia bacterium]
MNAEIISVGTELLLGEIVNTDAQFLSTQLSELGINVYYHTVVGDNKERLKAAVKTALERSDILIASGGLGPTPDDLTKEVIAEEMNRELILDENSLERMEVYLKRKNLHNVMCNRKQAMLPKECVILPNDCGTAPGCIIEENGKIAVMLPGPPHELQCMYLNYVKPYLIKKSDCLLYSENLKLFGIGESKVSEILNDYIENNENPTVAPYAEAIGVRLRITARCANEQEGKKLIKPIKEDIMKKVGDYVYNDTGDTLPYTVVHMLIERNMTISSAESCTGGMFAKMITDISGSSTILNESYVTYANEAKTKILGVKPETLKKYGAVSEETAYEMAEGLYKVAGADICVCFTGIAGPDGGTAEKPVGLVYVGVAVYGAVEVKKLQLYGSRDRVRNAACLEVFDIIRKKII